MKIGLRQAQHPAWVEDLFQQMDAGLRDRLVKTAILALVQPEGEAFRLHSFLQRKANRIAVLPTAQDVVTAFRLAEAWLAYEAYETDDKTGLKYRDEEGREDAAFIVSGGESRLACSGDNLLRSAHPPFAA